MSSVTDVQSTLSPRPLEELHLDVVLTVRASGQAPLEYHSLGTKGVYHLSWGSAGAAQEHIGPFTVDARATLSHDELPTVELGAAPVTLTGTIGLFDPRTRQRLSVPLRTVHADGGRFVFDVRNQLTPAYPCVQDMWAVASAKVSHGVGTARRSVRTRVLVYGSVAPVT